MRGLVSGTVGEQPAAVPQAERRTPDLLYSEPERALRDSLRSLLEARCAWPDVLARTESGETYDTALWRVIAAELGCAGLLIPEHFGGAGASAREAAVVAEEAGRFVAPVPYLGSSVVATTALLPVAAEARADPKSVSAQTLLRRLAEGGLTAALAVGFATSPGEKYLTAVRVAGSRAGDPAGVPRLRGTVKGVADALTADVLLVPADGVLQGLYVVEADAPGLRRTGVVSLDMTRQLCDIELDDVPASVIASGAAASRAVGAALAAGAAVLASEQLGMAQRCLEMTVSYLKERKQFARPLGSFQALKHRLADLWVDVTQAQAAARYAAACLASGDPDAPVATALAKARCSEVAVHAAEECIQLHGGIGFTWEHPAHLYLKRVRSTSIAFGTPDAHRASLASLADIPAP
jgi:alkylation response protein AidB-like acyl-CoA dehydrogenase